SADPGGPIAQYPAIDAGPFLLQPRLRSRHRSLVRLFPRAFRPRLVDRRPVAVVFVLSGLCDAILPRNRSADLAQPRSATPVQLASNRHRDPASSRVEARGPAVAHIEIKQDKGNAEERTQDRLKKSETQPRQIKTS